MENTSNSITGLFKPGLAVYALSKWILKAVGIEGNFKQEVFIENYVPM